MLAKVKTYLAIGGAALFAALVLWFYFSYTGLQADIKTKDDQISSLSRQVSDLKKTQEDTTRNDKLTGQSQVNLVNQGIDLTKKTDKETARLGNELTQINTEYEATKETLANNSQLDKEQLQAELVKAEKVKDDKTSQARLQSLWNTYCLTEQCSTQ